MKWKKGESAVSLTQSDMRIIAQCKMPFTEMLRQHPNKNIPPLWSVLSYAMLRQNSKPECVWIHYRMLKEVQENTARYYYHRQIPKAAGGFRELYIPQPFLQLEQAFIRDTILSALPVDDHAYAYRKGVCITDCAQPHVKQDVLIHLDIHDFFGSITEDMVYETLLRETGYTKALCRILARSCCLNGHLPQGTVASPMLSNIVFRCCDIALTQIADEHHLQYTRYSDDLYFSGDSGTDVQRVLHAISHTLLSFGFRLNANKTQVRRQQHRQAVLGLTVNDHLQVNRTYRRNLMQELYYLERFGKNCKGAIEAGDYWKYMEQLQGKLAYVLHMDPNNSQLWEAHLKLALRMTRYARFREKKYLF